MRFLRRFALLAALAAGSAVLAGPAFATAPDPSLTYTVGTTHFLVHYTTNTVHAFAVTATQAADAGALAERALNAELADGYSVPPPDGGFGGDNRVDIFLQDIASLGEAGEADPLNAGASAGYIILDASEGTSMHVVAHELFHLMQFAHWASGDVTDAWLYEAAAEWMGYRADGYSTENGAFPIAVGKNDFSLDCRDPNFATGIECQPDVYYNNGYSRWSFFEFLNERYGAAFVDSIFSQLALGGDGTALASLSNALAAKGTTLAATYDAWALAELADSYSVKALQGLHPAVYTEVDTGVDPGSTSVHVPLNHLSMRFVKFVRGDNDASHACYAATLNVSVAIPAGVTSVPAFMWDGKGSTPVVLAVNGSTATAAIPWDTCTYQSNAGWLVLPNASTNVDAADFVVTTSMTVDTTKPATPVPPPDPVTETTPVVPVSNADVAPSLDLFGPEVLSLSPSETQLRLIVESNGPGTVKAALGATVLGTVTIRGGANDLRFKLPVSLLKSLRRAAGSNRLTLTPSSPSGVVGQAVTRTVQVLQPKPKKTAKRRK